MTTDKPDDSLALSGHASKLAGELREMRIYANQVMAEHIQLKRSVHRWLAVPILGFFSRAFFKCIRISTVPRTVAPARPTEQATYKQIMDATAPYTGTPETVVLDVSSRCNLRCRMCFHSQMTPADFACGELTTRSLNNCMGLLMSAQVVNLFGSGEPFLAGNLDSILEMCDSSSQMVTVCTNGTIFNPAIKRALRAVSKLVFSVDAANKALYEHIRCGANFETVCSNIQTMRACFPGMFMAFVCTLAQYNVAQVEPLIELASRLGMQQIQFTRMTALSADGKGDELTNDEEFLSELRHRATACAHRFKIDMEVLV